MKYKVIKIFSFIFFILLFLNFLVSNYIVKAYVIDVTTGYEDGIVNNQYSTFWHYTKQDTQVKKINYNISSLNPREGTKSFRISGGGVSKNARAGWFNYTYSLEKFIHLWEIYIYFQNVATGCVLYFNNSDNDCIIQLVLYTVAPNSSVGYIDYLGAYHKIETLLMSSYYRLGFVFTANDSINYYYHNTLISGATPRNILPDCDIRSMSYCTFADSSPDWGINYIDSHRCVFSDTVSASGETTILIPECSCTDCEIGTVSTTGTLLNSYPYQYIFFVYKVKSQFNISRLDFLINPNSIVDETQIKLKVNQYDLGTPNSFQTIYDKSLMSWVNLSGVQITGEMVYFCFKLPSKPQYILPPSNVFYMSTSDIDNDGFIYFVCHNDNIFYENFNSGHTYRDTAIGGGNPYTMPNDLIYRMCYDYPFEMELKDFENDLWVNPLSITIPDVVTIGYTISNDNFLSYDNYIRINKSGFNYLNKKLELPTGSIDFSVFETGVYNVSLIQNNIITETIQFNATGTLPPYYIYTNVGTTKTNTDFKIYYSYVSTSYNGAITYNICDNSKTEITKITQNTTGNMMHQFSQEGYYTLTLNINPTGDTYYEVASTTIVINNGHSTYLKLSDELFVLPVNGKTITIYGEHNFVGSDIRIYRNGNAISNGDVSCYPMFSIYHLILDEGKYNFTLTLEQNNTILVLDYKVLTVTVPPTITPPPEDIVTKAIRELPDFLKLIFAVVITLMITMSPLIVITTLSKTAKFSSVELPSLVYVGFFIFGVSVNCIIGFLHYAVLFIILLGLIIAFAIKYISEKGE